MVPNLAIIDKNHCFPDICQIFGIFFIPIFCHFLKYQVSVLTKDSVWDYLSNEYPTAGKYVNMVSVKVLLVFIIVAVGVVLCYTTVLRLFTFSDLALAFQRFTCYHCLQMQGLMMRSFT